MEVRAERIIGDGTDSLSCWIESSWDLDRKKTLGIPTNVVHSNDPSVFRGIQDKAWSWMLRSGRGELNEWFYDFRCGLNEDSTIVRSEGLNTLSARLKSGLRRNVFHYLRSVDRDRSTILIDVRFESAKELKGESMNEALRWFETARGLIREGLR